MNWPFVSRKRYDAVTGRMAEAIASLEDEVDKLRYQENTELHALRMALFHRDRAEKLEKHILRGAETRFQPPFIPDQAMLDAIADNAHNAQETRTSEEPVVNNGVTAADKSKK